MLQWIEVQNYAIIDQLEMEFYPGLSIITGETGAGKSIIVGALSLIIGQRADSSMLKDEDKKCVVEAAFNIQSFGLKGFFEKHDLDYDNQTLVRREVRNNGKSRAFINDTPVPVSTLKELGIYLIDIHSQHQTLELGKSRFQLQVVDAYAKDDDLLDKYRASYQEYRDTLQQYKVLMEKSDQAKSDLDYYQYQYKQLEEVQLEEGEQASLEEELQELNHAEEIKRNLLRCVELFSGEESSVVANVKEAGRSLDDIRSFFPKVKELFERMNSAGIELEDIARELEALSEDVEFDPRRIEIINERLNLIYSLQQKHKLGSVKELIRLKDSLGEKINEIEHYDDQLEDMKKKLDQQQSRASELADQLSKERTGAFEGMKNQIEDLLQQMGMPNASFVIHHETKGELGPDGADEITFLFSANRQVAPQDLSKIASGGEMSRVMLSLKYIVSRNSTLPTIIFDEIDSGVSGEIAYKMGNILKQLSQRMQVINITHLPQIAGKGDYHYCVYKKETETATHTYIKTLEYNERLEELAKMLSGEELTEAALSNARELLNH